MSEFLKEFKTGFLVPLRGAEILGSSSRLRKLAIVPVLVSIIIFVVGLFTILPFLFSPLPGFATALATFVGVQIGTFLFSVLYWAILIFSFPAVLFAGLYLIFLISYAVAIPFHGFLAERVLIHQGLVEDRPFAFFSWLRMTLWLLGVSLIKLAVFAVIGIFLFFLSLIPAVGLLGAFGFLLMAAFDIIDTSLEVQQLSFGERLQFFRSEIPAFTGLATVLGLVFFVPGLNFILLPVSIAGGSEIVRLHKLKASRASSVLTT